MFPTASIMLVNQVWWSQYQGLLIKLLAEHCAHEGFSKTNHIRKKNTAVFVYDFLSIQDCVILILQFLKSFGAKLGIKLCVLIDLFLEILVEEF